MEETHPDIPDATDSIQDIVTHFLPVEIVAQVFIHFMAMVAYQPFSWRGDSARYYLDCQSAPPMILSAVCRSWRNIAVVTPELWTSPNIVMYDERTSDMVVEILDLWLNRSRNLPLHISFVGDVNWMLDYSYWEPIFERAKTCSERWETLRLEMSRKAWCHFFEGFRCPPSLKGIRLVAPAGEDREWELDSPAEFIRPTLHGLEELHIQNVSWQEVDIAWENLIVFEAGPWDFFGFELLLSHAPRLKKCRILYMGSIFHSPTVHSHLEDLELWNSSSISLEDVIRQFTFPSLKRLVYRPGTSRFSSQVPPVGARMDRLQSFVVRSQCPLIELEIHIPFKTTADLAKVLAHLPSLECLTLSTDRRYRDNSALWLSDISFAEHLKFSVLSRLLPQLKVFRIEGKRAFSWDALIAFLKPPHRHVTSKRNTCVHIQFALSFPSQERSENYIDRDVVLRLKRRERKWKGAVSLDIKHRDSGEDWMQASLDYHEQASSILE